MWELFILDLFFVRALGISAEKPDQQCQENNGNYVHSVTR